MIQVSQTQHTNTIRPRTSYYLKDMEWVNDLVNSENTSYTVHLRLRFSELGFPYLLSYVNDLKYSSSS